MIVKNPANSRGPTDHNANSITPKSSETIPYGAPKIATTNETNEKEEAITDLYMSDGDDYYIDDSAFAGAQLGTGDNETAASVVGSGGSNGSSETNSNVNTGVFGGPAKAAKPGASLW